VADGAPGWRRVVVGVVVVVVVDGEDGGSVG